MARAKMALGIVLKLGTLAARQYIKHKIREAAKEKEEGEENKSDPQSEPENTESDLVSFAEKMILKNKKLNELSDAYAHELKNKKELSIFDTSDRSLKYEIEQIIHKDIKPAIDVQVEQKLGFQKKSLSQIFHLD